jgi:hypothetical protein
MMRQFGSLLALAIVLGLPIGARAELTLAFTDATITPGGTATIDVTVNGDGEIAVYNFDFRIERIFGAGDLQFESTQNLLYRDLAHNYVFGNFGQKDPSPQSTVDTGAGGSGTTADPSFGAYQHYYGSDTYLDLNPDPNTPQFATVNGSKLLARLQLTAPSGGFAPEAGSIFKVYYVSQSDPDQNITDYSDGIQGNFGNTTYGTVTVQAVPEPAAVVSVLSGLALVAAGQGWRRRRDRRVKVSVAR